jgi:hypothetical protein
MGKTTCDNTPRDQPIGASEGKYTLAASDVSKVLTEMITTKTTKEKNPKPMIRLFRVDGTGGPSDIERVLCEAQDCDNTASLFANCRMAMNTKNEAQRNAEAEAELKKLADEQEANDQDFKELYGTYELTGCGDVNAYFHQHHDEGCRMAGVTGATDYWTTNWKQANKSNEISVKYTSTRPMVGNWSETFTRHINEGSEPGWHSMDRNYNVKRPLIIRSALNSLCVRNMTIRKLDGTYSLCGAHRLNFNYHKSTEPGTNQDTEWWGAKTYADANPDMLSRMKAAGLATPNLFDPLGLIWLLLWKKDVPPGLGREKYHVCAAYMHPHFADLINGTLPENYNVCTATRWWNNAIDKHKWFNNVNDPNTFHGDLMKRYITNDGGTDKTWWVADKIRKPFFRILNGSIKPSHELDKALVLEGERAGSTIPLRKLIDILMYVYFDEPIPHRTPKTQDPAKPVTDGTNGNLVPSVTTGAGGNPGAAGNSGTPGAAGNKGADGANDHAVVTETKNKLPADKTVEAVEADDASKEAGTRTPVPTGTGTPAKEESFWDKNQNYIIIGIIVGGLVLLLIVAFIVLSRRRREAGYEQLEYSDPGSEYPLESLGEGTEDLGEGTEDLLGGEGPEGLLGGETGPIRFGF